MRDGACLTLLEHEKGYIADPKNREKSVVMTEEGHSKAETVFNEFFRESDGWT